MLITIGVLFLLANVGNGDLGFGRTWPAILLVIGLVKLVQSHASSEGHISLLPLPTAQPSSAPPPPTPPSSDPGTPSSSGEVHNV
jgi:hypothetical protein